jgi:hypothetical protein
MGNPVFPELQPRHGIRRTGQSHQKTFIADDDSTSLPSEKRVMSLRLKGAVTTQIRRGFTSSPPANDAIYKRVYVVARFA